MKSITKLTGIFFFSLVTAANANNFNLYDKLYRLAEKMYYIEDSLSSEQQRAITELSSQLELIINGADEISCGTQSSTYQDAYQWAYSRNGMDLTSSEADKFAADLFSKYCPKMYLKTFKSAYDFAYEIRGMNRTRIEARSVATNISNYEAATFYIKKALQCFIDSYTFAYSSGGMNKTSAEAELFANQLCLVPK